ncbi:hypothetical protein SESBI_18357 [Sesbania bispinosa]|nr:hypothetical protein SESBI_18357 [Sesbania bispinosa]
MESLGVKLRSSPRFSKEDVGIFSNKEIEAKFETSLKSRKVLLGRLMDLECLISRSNWDLTPYTRRQYWSNFFEVGEKVYPTITRAFYV